MRKPELTVTRENSIDLEDNVCGIWGFYEGEGCILDQDFQMEKQDEQSWRPTAVMHW